MAQQTKTIQADLPLAKTPEQVEFWNKLAPVNRVATTDTYKRTMSGSSALFANNFTCYNLAARKALKEEGVNGRYIMAGIEKMLYPWFMKPITEEEITKAKEFFTKHGKVDKFSNQIWQKVLDNQGYMPVNIWGLPGGQTFLVKDRKYTPMMSVEGAGGLVTHLEPHLEQIFAPLIQATKARLMFEVTGNKFAEFGLRANENENNHVTLNHAVYVGAGFRLTSDDQAVFLFPEYFDDIGTVGHEFIMAYQQQGRTLEQAQELAFCDFVAANKRSALLTDTIDTLKSGLPAILKLIKENKGNGKIILPRFDSGDVPAQCIYWKKMTLDAGITETQMVVEDGYTPEKAKKTKQMYAAAGFNPEEIIVGAGGYFQENNLRDTASLVYKRSATEHDGRLEASLKFSDSPGKESIPGQIRIYEKGRNLVVAQEGEKIDGKMLSVQLVKNGRINYFENLAEQNARANTTWQNYDNIEYSPATQAIINERTKEKTEIMRRLR